MEKLEWGIYMNDLIRAAVVGKGGRFNLPYPLSIEEDAFFNSFAADWTFRHAVTTHLTRSVTTEEDHIAQSVHAHGAHCLQMEN